MDIEVLDPALADVRDLRGCHEVFTASEAIDAPNEPPMSFDHFVGRFRNPSPEIGPTDWWIAYHEGTVTGLAIISYPAAENDHVAMVNVYVHPDHRRRGMGTALLRALLPVVRERGRNVIDGWAITKGGSGDEWSRSLGFSHVHSTVIQAIQLKDVDSATWQNGPERGYRLEDWIGAAPDHLVASLAGARAAIHDAPTGDAAYRSPDWTPERVREIEAELVGRGIEQYTVVAVYAASGDVVGLTEVAFHPHRSDRAYQGDTVVLPEHRGHRLGVAMKSHMLRWLARERPELREIRTSTGASNVYMVRVNHELGFKDLREQVVVKASLVDLEARIGSAEG